MPVESVERSLAAALAPLLGERLSTNPAVRERHGQGESYHPSQPPDAVVFPQSTEEVAEIVRLCAKHRTPVIAFGTGTSLEGHVGAVRGGVCIDLGGMNRVLEVNVDDLDCRVQAGVTRKQLNAYVKDTGLFFPIDPGADASLGGMTATRGSGTMAVRYGTMRENVLGLTVVLADGRVIRTGTRARKSAAGYDLTRLFVGSEGTLGVITEIALRLHPVPQAISSAVCAFPALADAVSTVITAIQSGIPVARIELLDDVMMRGVNAHAGFDYAERPTLFFEFHGTEAAVAEQAGMLGEIARERGGLGFQWATRPEERSRLWQARDNTLYAGMALRPGSKALITDVCVPISRLAECIVETRRDIDASGLVVPIVGHVGDGNFHLLVLVKPGDAGELARAEALNERLVHRALAMGGTCTGEHGIGAGKIAFLAAEHGESVAVMRAVKAALDPQNLMNPGKIFAA
ncbi:MAG: FAD-binding protein [Burkholderiales bacterium]|nr:FAD-binding protein [Burkholderiales bacterium]